MSQNPVSYVSFSGGGWNSHTVSSGMISSALDAGNSLTQADGSFDLSDLFKSASGIAGNSGGSWFTSMLAYSKEFADDLSNNSDQWFDSGYMGQEAQLFHATDGKQELSAALKTLLNQVATDNVTSLPLYNVILGAVLGNASWAKSITIALYEAVNDLFVDAAFSLVSSDDVPADINLVIGLASIFYNTENPQGAPSWLNAVNDIVFAPYDMNQSLNGGLDIAQNDWMEGKSLIYAGSMPQQKTIESFDSLLSYIDTSASERSSTGIPGGVIVPLSIIVDAQHSNPTMDFLGYKSDGASGSEYVVYTKTDSILGATNTTSFDIPNISQAQFSVIDAATLSGSFAGAIALVDNFSPMVTQLMGAGKTWLIDAIKSNGIFQILPGFLQDAVVLVISTFIDGFTNAAEVIAPVVAPPVTNYLKDFSLPVSFEDGQASVASSQNDSTQRFIDGGYTDNTAVGSILAEISNTFGDADFEITAFVNNTGTGTISEQWTGASQLTVGSDIPLLFGDGSGDPFPTYGYAFPGNPTVATPAIFNQSAWQGETAVWSYVDETSNTHLDYYRLDVETIDNAWWGVDAGQEGVLHLFSTYNTASGPGPYFTNAFELYEEIYGATRDGMLSNGGYVHLLEALGVTGMEWGKAQASGLRSPSAGNDFTAADVREDDGTKMQFVAPEGFSVKTKISVLNTDTIFPHPTSVEVYRINNADGASVFQGTIGNVVEEAGIDYTDTIFDIVRMNAGESLEFLSADGLINTFSGETLFDFEEVDGGYTADLIDNASGRKLLSLFLEYVAMESEFDHLAEDLAFRDDQSDAYLYLDAGDKVSFDITAAAAMKNTVSMIKLDVDESSGAISFHGYEQDTREFDEAVRWAVEGDLFFDKASLAPYSEMDAASQGVVEESGYYAPVLLTGNGDLFLTDHNLYGDNSQATIIGYNTFAFEDLRFGSNGFGDFNDCVVHLTVDDSLV